MKHSFQTPARALSLRLTLSLFALGLGGCATFPGSEAGVAPETIPAAAAERWQVATPPGLSETPVALAQWWQTLGDPVLPQLQAAAQVASPGLSAARNRVEQARTGLAQAGARNLPGLDAVASARSARDVPNAPRNSSLSLGVQAAWEIDLFGGNASGTRAAAERLQGSEAAWHGARVALMADVAATYAGLRACEGQLALARTDAVSRAETARLTELTAKAGLQAPANAALARASAAQGQSIVTAQAANCDALVKALVSLTALPEAKLREQLRAGTAQLPKPRSVSLPSVPATLLGQRPDVFGAAREVAASAAEITQADAEQWPRLGLSGSISGLRLQTSGAPSLSGNTFTIGPLQLTLPLLDGGVRRAQSAAARARYQDATVQYQASVRQAVREVEEALISLNSSAARDEDARTAAVGFEANFKAADARFRGGLGSLFELEDARRSAAAAQSALIELERERLIAFVNLYRALGGGFDASAPQIPVASENANSTRKH